MNTTANEEATAAEAVKEKAAELKRKLREHAAAMTELRDRLCEHANTLTAGSDADAAAHGRALLRIADDHKEACDAFATDAQARVGPTA